MNIMKISALINTYYKIIQLLLNIVADRFVMFVYSFTSFDFSKNLIKKISLHKIDFVFGLLFRIPKSRWARCFGIQKCCYCGVGQGLLSAVIMSLQY